MHQLPISVGPDEIHPGVLRQLVKELTKPLSIICEKSSQSGQVPTEWKRGNITHIFKSRKNRKTEGTTGQLILPVCGKMVELIFLEVVLKHVENKEIIHDS